MRSSRIVRSFSVLEKLLGEDATENADPVALQIGCHAKGLAFASTTEASAPATLTTDPERVQQVLGHLADNALKFTAAGAVSVTARGREGGDVEIKVTDTGAGIEPRLQPRLFDRFVQGDMSTTRLHGGTGIGLALARGLARALGGDVVLAQSAPGRGSTFALTLP